MFVFIIRTGRTVRSGNIKIHSASKLCMEVQQHEQQLGVNHEDDGAAIKGFNRA